VLVPGLLGTIVSMWRNLFADPSTTGRTGDYAILFDVFGDNPVLGRGQFTFIPQYYRIMDNQFLVTLVELGLVGFTALLGLFLTSYLCARGARKRAGALSHQHLGLALSASIAGVFVAYATFDALGFAMVAGLTFLLFGLAGATWQLARGDQVSAVERTAAGPASAPAPLSTEKAVAG
jgi:O-antigen ligase